MPKIRIVSDSCCQTIPKLGKSQVSSAQPLIIGGVEYGFCLAFQFVATQSCFFHKRTAKKMTGLVQTAENTYVLREKKTHMSAPCAVTVGI